jgi:outer membrane receptor for ferric coprogen and ferric-rhodotorulic acid
MSRHALIYAAFFLTTTCLTVPGRAQEAAPTTLPPVTVEGQETQGYKPETSASPKYTQPLRDTPQSINVVPREVFEDRGATTLRDVLRCIEYPRYRKSSGVRSLAQQSSREFPPAVPTTRRSDGQVQGHKDSAEIRSRPGLDP